MKTNLVCKHAMKLLFSYSQAFSVGAINNQDDNLLHLEGKIIHLVKAIKLTYKYSVYSKIYKYFIYY